MKMFLVTFVFMFSAILMMGIGYFFAGNKLKGSCGGLGKIMGEACHFCEKKEQCKTEEDPAPMSETSFYV